MNWVTKRKAVFKRLMDQNYLGKWTIMGGLIAGVVIFTLAPDTQGHGTDETIAAFHMKDGKIRHRVP